MKGCRSSVYVFLVAMVCVMAGCASGPAFKKIDEIPQGKGLVYIYRPAGIVGSAIAYDVYAGTEKVGRLVPGGYLTYLSSPGELEIWGKTESKGSVTLDVRTGQEHYVKGSLGVGFLVGRPVITVVEPQVGQKEIQDCKQNSCK
jgi:hypothetical protein